MKRQLLIILGMATWVITMFQNCGPNPIQFGTDIGLTKIVVNDGSGSNANPVDTIIDNTTNSGGSSSSSGLVAASSGSSSSGAGSGSSSTLPPRDAQADYNADSADIAAEKDDDYDCKKDDDTDRDNDAKQNGKNHKHKGRHYVCMLDGKSVAIGFNDGVGGGQVGSPKVICMARETCEEIADVKFQVKEAVHKDYCMEDSDNVLHLTRGDVEDLLLKMK